jgi:hypothetical protein
MFGTVNENYDGCSGDWRGGQIVDTVLIPIDIEPGQWVLGWRCECAISRCHAVAGAVPCLYLAADGDVTCRYAGE